MQVVGAGRGPLVQASLNAGVTAGRTLKVYAVEKNANAVITLRNRAIMDGWENVTIVSKDMRQWVSETRHCAFRDGYFYTADRSRFRSSRTDRDIDLHGHITI